MIFMRIINTETKVTDFRDRYFIQMIHQFLSYFNKKISKVFDFAIIIINKTKI